MKQQIALAGFYFAFVAFLAIVGYGVVQILQVVGAVHYPLDSLPIYGFSLAIGDGIGLPRLGYSFFLVDPLVLLFVMQGVDRV